MNQIHFVEFCLGDGDERPSSWKDISKAKVPSPGEALEHQFTFFIECRPCKVKCEGFFDAYLAWDGITQSSCHSNSDVQAFAVEADSGTILGSPTPIIEFHLPNDLPISEFLEGWEVTCSPHSGFYYEDWSGRKRVLDPEEIEKRGLGKVLSKDLMSPSQHLCHASLTDSLAANTTQNCSISSCASDRSESNQSGGGGSKVSRLLKGHTQALELLSKRESENYDFIELVRSQIKHLREFGKRDMSSFYDLFDFLDETADNEIMALYARFPDTQLRSRILGYNKNVPPGLLQDVASELMESQDDPNIDADTATSGLRALKSIAGNKLTPASTLGELFDYSELLGETVIDNPNCPEQLRSA